MKQKLSYIFTLLALLAGLLLPATALAAHSAGRGSDDTTGDSTSSSSDDTTQIETENHTSEDRITKFKAKFKVNLSETETGHIKLKCVNAQSVVGNLRSHFGEKSKARISSYANLQSRLETLVVKLKAKNVDTKTLEAEIVALNAKITTFNTDLTAYKQALADLKEVACKDDPVAFQAALLAARSTHETLITDVKAIRTYMKDTIKPTLQDIKQQLESQSDTTDGSN